MKKLVIYIEYCDECSYYDQEEESCMLEEKVIPGNAFDIPDWCPLDDVQKGAAALKVEIKAYLNYINGEILELDEKLTKEEIETACHDYVMDNFHWKYKIIDE